MKPNRVQLLRVGWRMAHSIDGKPGRRYPVFYSCVLLIWPVEEASTDAR